MVYTSGANDMASEARCHILHILLAELPHLWIVISLKHPEYIVSLLREWDMLHQDGMAWSGQDSRRPDRLLQFVPDWIGHCPLW